MNNNNKLYRQLIYFNSVIFCFCHAIYINDIHTQNTETLQKLK